MKRQHKTKWTIWYIHSQTAERCDSEAEARCIVLTYIGDSCPVTIYPPLYMSYVMI